MKTFVLVLIGIALLAFAGGARLTPPRVTPSHLGVVTVARDSSPDEDIDAYGNEVTNAVAEYSLDPAGTLYELHSPQIELPHLGSPKS